MPFRSNTDNKLVLNEVEVSASQLSKYKRLFNLEDYFGHELNSAAVAEIDTLRLLNENTCIELAEIKS
jgi:hypothetical protein